MIFRRQKEYLYFIKVQGSPARYKLGITKSLPQRFRSISRDTKYGNDRILKYIRIPNARSVEEKLKDRYHKQRRYFRQLKGNGGTEVFAFNPIQVQEVKIRLARIAIWYWMKRMAIDLVLVALIIVFIKSELWKPVLEFLLNFL